jgi:uncharacterized membrane protein
MEYTKKKNWIIAIAVAIVYLTINYWNIGN